MFLTFFEGLITYTIKLSAVVRFKLANMARETEALQSWIEVRLPDPMFL